MANGNILLTEPKGKGTELATLLFFTVMTPVTGMCPMQLFQGLGLCRQVRVDP